MNKLYQVASFVCIVCLGFQSLFASAQQLDFCFDQLKPQEIDALWAKEYLVAVSYAQKQDYVKALHYFEHAYALCPENSSRSLEVQYGLLLCYFYLHDYEQLIRFFESHSILYAASSFKAYQDLLVILHHSYERLGQSQKAELVLSQLSFLKEEDKQRLKLSSAIIREHTNELDRYIREESDLNWLAPLTQGMLLQKKSPKLAQWLNLIVPGAGYWYTGQKKAAVTAFVLNSLLILGAIKLFMKQHYALAALTAIFEIGWYVGGAMGARQITQDQNEMLFGAYLQKVFSHQSLDPMQELQFDF